MRPLVQPLVTSLAALAFATSLVGCGSDDKTDLPTNGAGAGSAEGAGADKVQKALAAQAKKLAGIDDPAKLAKATCTAVDDAFDCLASGAAKQQAIRVVLGSDGNLTKRLSGNSGALKTSSDVANALAADDKARGVDPAAAYGCATSGRTEPDGSQQPGGPTGYLCFGTGGTPAKNGAPQARYVEPGDDGALTRDYIVQAPTGG